MAKVIFVNLPVADVAKSTAFYEAIGMTKDERFSGEQAAAMVWSDTIVFMLLDHGLYSTFTSKRIADARETSLALISLSRDSREEVDAITEAAIAAGGIGDLQPPQDLGFMYSRDLEDLDGHGLGVFWMDAAAHHAAMAPDSVAT